MLPEQEALQAESAAPEDAVAAAPAVHMRHFQAALGRVQPSVNAKDQRVYSALRQRLRRCVWARADRHVLLRCAWGLLPSDIRLAMA